jgi:predicted NAD/FAD-dependent oxidoreductase
MKTAIIGAGISGSTFACLLDNVKIFERSVHAGGRSTSKRLPTGEIFDIGATVFKDSILYRENKKDEMFDLIEFLNIYAPELKIQKHPTYPNAYFPTKGMQSICEELLKGKDIFFEHTLESITRSEHVKEWNLKFSNGHSENFERVVLTSPIPQIISSLKTSGVIGVWDEFIKYRSEYRSSLVLTGIWKNCSTEVLAEIEALPQTTYLNKEGDIEYFSVESAKYKSNSLVISIQFSSAFSSKNLERWIDSNKNPLQYIQNSYEYFFDKILGTLNLKNLISRPPDSLKANKWRYSSADFPIFSTDEINLDSSVFKDYLSLCRKHNIWITGDWVFGSRMIKNALGSKILAKELKS